MTLTVKPLVNSPSKSALIAFWRSQHHNCSVCVRTMQARLFDIIVRKPSWKVTVVSSKHIIVAEAILNLKFLSKRFHGGEEMMMKQKKNNNGKHADDLLSSQIKRDYWTQTKSDLIKHKTLASCAMVPCKNWINKATQSNMGEWKGLVVDWCHEIWKHS